MKERVVSKFKISPVVPIKHDCPDNVNMNDLSQWRVRIIPGLGGFELKQLIHLIRDKLIDSKRSHDLN